MSVCPVCGAEIDLQLVTATEGGGFWDAFGKLFITGCIGGLFFLIVPFLGVIIVLAGFVWCFKKKTVTRLFGICPVCGYQVLKKP